MATNTTLISIASVRRMRLVGRPSKTACSCGRALGRVVGTPGQLGDLTERRLVDAAAEVVVAVPEPAATEATAEAAALTVRLGPDELAGTRFAERAALLGPEADGEDAQASVSRLLRGIDRQRAGVVGAVGQAAR